jgi:hypothetical protein
MAAVLSSLSDGTDCAWVYIGKADLHPNCNEECAVQKVGNKARFFTTDEYTQCLLQKYVAFAENK